MSATAETQEIGKKPATPRAVFILRFTSTIILWTVALLIAFSGFELAFWGLISAFGLISLWEFYGMLDQHELPNFKLTAMICGAAMLCGSFYYFSHFGLANSYEFETAVLLLFLLTVITRQMFARLREDEPLQAMAYTLFGLLYVLWLFKLMPGHLAALNWTHATILGLLLGFAAVIGDLAESIIKRSTGVKDSGRLLPGIGGALDLVDSLLFTAPLLFFYLRLVVRVP